MTKKAFERFIAEALEMAGHDVETAPDGDAAARRLEEASFDLLITDLKMPGLDGLQLLKRVRHEQPEVEVIMLTAHGSGRYRGRGDEGRCIRLSAEASE